ncbi:MAG: 2-amino-4-hydroxy-6-hydroxymethyldihydropteridine diphosphokinase [Pseudomonadota bacterium]
MAGPERVFVGLGANLGDAQASVRAALASLAGLAQSSLVAHSALYRSAPIEASGSDYVNAVAELRSELSPEVLLTELQALERAFGRERPYHHAPRTLDLDLLIYGQRQMVTPTLTLPHPRLHQRAFVLAPLAELAPAWQLANGCSVVGALAELTDQRIQRMDP